MYKRNMWSHAFHTGIGIVAMCGLAVVAFVGCTYALAQGARHIGEYVIARWKGEDPGFCL